MVAIVAFNSVLAFESDIISDVTTSIADESRALNIKAEQFWKPLQQAAEQALVTGHAELYKDVEKTLATLPPQHKFVRRALEDALSKLQRADAAVSVQASTSSQVAEQTLANPTSWETGFSFLTGGQNVFSFAMRKFTGQKYQDRLKEHIHTRQATILPIMQDMAKVNVLKDCRVASRQSYDILKYDIYNKDVPRTPEVVTKIANRIIEAVAETRHRFMQLVKESAKGVAQDSEGKQDHPSATVTHSLLEGMKPTLEGRNDELFISL